MNIELKKFDIKSISSDKVCVFIGKRDTGKSFLVKDLLYYHRDVPCGTVISGTESANSFYSSLVPSIFIHEQFSPDIIFNSLKRQKLIMKQINKDIDTKGKTDIDPRTFVILDDCLYDNTWSKDINIRNLFMNGRHYKILFIITMQYLLGVPPNLRTNVDYIFILRENIINNRKKLYDHYAGMFPTFEMFSQVMDHCTENYECLVIHNNAKSNKLEDQVFWYKAEAHEDFKVGDDSFWEYSKQLNAKNKDKEKDEEDYIFNKNKKEHYNVKKGY
jgi:hypothetical protein